MSTSTSCGAWAWLAPRSMLGALAAYELRFHLRRPVTWAFLALFVAEGIFFVGSDMDVVAGGGIGLVPRNVPFAIAAALLTFTAINQVIVAGLVGGAVLRDFQHRTHELVFTTPITKLDYLGGRFLGALGVMAIVHLGLPIGLLAGTWMPWVDQARLPPTTWVPYATLYATLVVPLLFVTTTLFFAVGALTRNLFAVYTQGLVLLVVQLVTGAWLANLDDQRAAALLDPFGAQAFTLMTRYWTAVERVTQPVHLTGLLLTNRLVWLGVAAAVLAATYARFRFRSAITPRGGSRTAPAAASHEPPHAAAIAAAPQRFDGTAWRAQVRSTARLTFLSTVRQVPFAAIVAVGVVLLLVSSRRIDAIYALPIWPVSYTVLDAITGSFLLFFVLLVTMYAGEAVWRERDVKANLVADALPSGAGTVLVGHLLGLVLMEVLLLAILMFVGMAIQTAKGFTHYEPLLYLRYLYGTILPSLAQLTVLALLVHAVVNQKLVGHAVMVLCWAVGLLSAQLGVGHPMLRYGQMPLFRYSDMNGFAPFVRELALYGLYWSGIAGLLGVLAFLFWVRGAESAWGSRWRAARGRGSRGLAVVAGASLLIAALPGAAIVRNISVLRQYKSPATIRHERARYERMYKPLQQLDQPRLVAADIRADLAPEQPGFALGGTFTFVNRHTRALDSLVLTLAHAELEIDSLIWDRPASLLVLDSAAGLAVHRLTTPLAPGDTVRLRYRARLDARPFAADGPTTAVTANGTYFRRDWFPLLGYITDAELLDAGDRRKEGLPPRRRVAALDDSTAWGDAFMRGTHADLIDFHAIVSTAPDQIAVAPGQLVGERTERGRRVFEYAADAPISNDYAVLSARYVVKREMYRGITLEILHHPGHTYNVDRMLAAMKATIDYCSARFGPYQFRQLRIAEFPRYAQYALAQPGLVPFSESAGFIFRPGDGPDDLDLPSYVTAHEVAHQWWGQQVAGADVQGVTWLSEGLANYTALAVMEQTQGRAALRTFLGYELDQYLLGRGAERDAERPLLLVEHQPYIHYNKGSLALFAYRDLIGEPAMTRALAGFAAATAFKGPPYTTSRELIGWLERETPDSLRYASTDQFRTITLWDNRALDATATPRPDGTFAVTLHIAAQKFRADSAGNEQTIPIADLIDVGVFGEPKAGSQLGAPLDVRKVWIRAADTTISFIVPTRPLRAGIDPYGTLIDRNRRDNLVAVTLQAPHGAKEKP